MTSSPRSRRPTISSVTSVAFSVEPSTSESGTFVPFSVIPSATTQHDSAKCTPSTMNATRSSVLRSVLSSSASAVSVRATNLRDTADLLVLLEACSTRSPTGSSPTG